MTAAYDVDPRLVQSVLGGHSRFACPFDDPPGYSILTENEALPDEAAVGLYLDKLKEAADNADALIRGRSGLRSSPFTGWTKRPPVPRRSCAAA